MSAGIDEVPPRGEAGLYPSPLGRTADLPARWPGRDRLQQRREPDPPEALTRKNALFAGHDEGGRSWARIASLIATAKVNGVEPFAYLKTILEAVAAGHPQARIDDLLPWNFKPSS